VEEKQGRIDKARPGRGNKQGGKIIGTTYENNGDTAVVEIEPTSKSQLPPGMTKTEMVLIKEDGKWKMDMMATSARMMQPSTFGKQPHSWCRSPAVWLRARTTLI
jgi:hypothetical protein